MPAQQSTKLIPVRMTVTGGLDTEFGPYAPFRLDGDGRVIVPYLVTADNVVYNADGWTQKMPGATRVNTTATGATDSITGIFDYWRQGTTGTAVQKRVIYAGTAIYKDDADGVWDSLLTGLQADKMPWAAMMNDEMILSSTSTTDVPQVYDQSTIANLGGTPPDFAFCVEHKNRLFAGGVPAFPSRLYFSRLGLHEDWTGAGSGSIDCYSDDGDKLTALHSTKEELLIFKGPYHGSILRMLGSSPTGAFAFALVPFVRGVGAINQQCLVRMRNDLLFWDQSGVHSLQATAAFGDYEQGFLSSGIARLFRDELAHSRLDRVWGAPFRSGSYVIWTASLAGSSTHNVVLMLDFRFDPPRWARWLAYKCASVGTVLDGSLGRIPWWGTYTGFVLRGTATARTVNQNAYTARTTLPYVTFGGDAFRSWGLVKGRIAFTPHDVTDFSVSYRRDGNPMQTVTITQEGTLITLGDAAAPADTDFMLDEDILGGADLRHEFFDLEGECKDLQLELGDVVSDFEPHDLGLMIEDHGFSPANTIG